MFFDYPLTIPADTSITEPAEDLVLVTHGVLHRLEIAFPAGCAGLAHLAILRGGFQIFPLNPGGYFSANKYTIPIDTYYELFTAPYALKLRGYNEDPANAHTITVRLGILPQEVAAHIFGRPQATGLERLRARFGLRPLPDLELGEGGEA